MIFTQLPKSFGLEELKKGFFPHFFNTPENQEVVLLNLPDICDRLKAPKGALFHSTLLTRPQTRGCGFSSPETLQTRVST